MMTNDRRKGAGAQAVTAVDVAQLAGVSPATVSRVMNPDVFVSEALTKRVKDAAQALGYTPNAIARSLSCAKTNIVGVVAVASSSYYYQTIIRISEQLQALGYQTLLFPIPNPAQMDAVISRILQYRLDGLMITGITADSKLYDNCVKHNIPTVLYGRCVEQTDSCVVACDNHAAGALAATRFWQAGRDRLACIYAGTHVSTSMERLHGFVQQAAVHGVEHNLSTISTDGLLTYEMGKSCTQTLFKGRKKPNAIFCINVDVAMGCMDALRFDLNLRIPEDVSVIGFDDSDVAAGDSYHLTTLVQPQKQMIDAAVCALLEQMQTLDSHGKQFLFDATLVERGTV